MRPLALLYNRLKLINPLMQHGCGMGAVREQIGSKKDESKQRLAPHQHRGRSRAAALPQQGVGLSVSRGLSDTVPHHEARNGGKSREEMH